MQKQKDVKKSDFSSLDIYLFSNGQQDSPPRKYNLRADELNWWEATLNYLARSHYGSKHASVELYTVDGRRLAGARELRAGAAYVAVAPPDRFLQSGYDNYLIKASRSWEKRQEKKSSNDALSLSETDKNDSNNITDVKDASNMKTYQDIILMPSTIIEEQTVVKSNNTNNKAKNNEPRPAKSMQKRKLSGPQQNPSILRKKYVNPVSPMAKKGSIPSREAPKVDTVKRKTDSRITKNFHKEPLLLKAESLVRAQTVKSEIESPDKICKQEGRDDIQEKEVPSTILVVESTHEIELSQKQDSADKDVLSKIYHNEEHHQSIFINPNIPTISNGKTKDKYESLHEYSEVEDKVIINSLDNDKNIIVSESYYEVHGNESKTNVIRSTDVPPPQQPIHVPPLGISSREGTAAPRAIDKKLIVCGNQTSDSFAICINPGETVNLKLSLEIKSIPVSIGGGNCKSPDCRKSEKGIQGQVATAVENESLHSCCEQTGQSVPRLYQTLQQNNPVQEAINDMKTVVCHCDCCCNSEKVIPFEAPPNYDTNNDFILIPSESLNENFLGCNCILETPSKSKLETVDNLKKSTSLAEKLRKDSIVSAKERSILETSSKISNCDPNYKCTDLTTSMMKNDGQTTDVICDRCISNTTVNATDCANGRSSTTHRSGVSDASTQSDWARLLVLMEVRLHEDGHYSFHLPPLELLKLYDAI